MGYNYKVTKNSVGFIELIEERCNYTKLKNNIVGSFRSQFYSIVQIWLRRLNTKKYISVYYQDVLLLKKKQTKKLDKINPELIYSLARRKYI